MAYNVFVLDDSRSWFVELKRIDPMTRRQFLLGDSVVICNGCKTAFLESTWDDCGGVCVAPGCGCRITSERFVRRPPPKPRSAADGLNRIIITNRGVIRRDETNDDGSLKKMVVRRVSDGGG